MQTYYPPIIGIEELSQLLKRSEGIIRKDRATEGRKHTLPPARKIHNTKNPLWITEDVIDWLRQQPDDAEVPKMGAPTKRERIEKRKAAEKQNSITNSESGR